ncbi:MAG: bifunctional methylenetetrahydrofolate dehydrogenase/methenyltetrahydrofolate cyclohydrolase FolD [Ruminococcaceae bacterium]|jgi:methylenetetrahydrofolate dehydrogenase (NADP+)/methenyltetrahydrofolate cyclohydrolase|nr:bifunctional methylenetetrahydrofolate dehydrogenase/methenyltetrahydrofolate cyclohydrolase FolD [Oscillospiraceae bacterium]
MARIIDGKLVSSAVKEGVAVKVNELKKQGINPCLAVIIVGNNPASRTYVNNKKKACEATGIISKEIALDESASTEELLSVVEELNKDSSVHGILCQLPVPKQIDKNRILAAISPDKDVDAFHAINVGRLLQGVQSFQPCTPAGVIRMLEYYNISVEGKNCVVIGRSDIVGKPMAVLLMQKDGTVTVAHSKTKNLKEVTSKADILVSTVGKANFVTADMVKDGAVVIDVGINRNAEGKLCGDVIFDEVEKKASYITPVPGGVGPMTVSMLLENTVTAAKIQNGIE